MTTFDPKRVADFIALLRDSDDRPRTLLPMCSVRDCPNSADPRWFVYVAVQDELDGGHPACDAHGGHSYDRAQLRDPLPTWPRRGPIGAEIAREIADKLEAALARITTLEEALTKACEGWRESYDQAGLAGDNNWPCGHDYIDELKALAARTS